MGAAMPATKRIPASAASSSSPPSPGGGLEARLAELTAEFVANLVEAIRSASLGEVAALSMARVQALAKAGVQVPAAPGGGRSAMRQAAQPGGRQTAERRAEIGQRVIETLEAAGKPLGARVIASELGVPVDLLAVPLRELRAAGRVQKHGEKRATTYSAA
jgi:hypothetical protein